jgi:osmotically-inducible protein OsmY
VTTATYAARAVLEAESSMKKYSYVTAVILAVALIAPLLAGCGKSVGDTIDDATITTRVKTALLNDPDVGGLRIDVDTFKGVVTLSGRVKSKEEETKAVSIARKIGGVTDVKSTLQIQP